MDEYELEDHDMDWRAELEDHLYSAIHHNDLEMSKDHDFEITLSKRSLEHCDLDVKNVLESSAMSENVETSIACDISNSDVISINDSEDDDIIEIKPPPPPLICIESDESDDECAKNSSFNHRSNEIDKPKESVCTNNQSLDPKNSTLDLSTKCASPTSTASDDFIQNDCENLDRSEMNDLSFRFSTHPELNFSSSTQVYNYCAGNDSSSECSELPTNNEIFVHSEDRNGHTSAILHSAKNGSEILDLSDTFHEVQNYLSKYQSTPTSHRSLDYSKNPTEDNSRAQLSTKSLEKMQSFYSKSWGGETFNHNSIISHMSRDKDKWKINISDRQRNQRARGWKQMRCHNCHQMGHSLMQCPEPKHIIKCYMCGMAGHAEPRCPNKICLKCGRPSSSFLVGCRECKEIINMCHLCGMPGHNQYNCPDLWRRYHRSIDSTKTPIAAPFGFKPPHKLFCSNCSMRGHLYHNCRRLKFNEHSALLPNVLEYTPVYPVDDNLQKEKPVISNNSRSEVNTVMAKTKDKTNMNKSLSKKTKSNESSFLTSLNDFEAFISDESLDDNQSFNIDRCSDMENELQSYLIEQSQDISLKGETKTVQNSKDQIAHVEKQIVNEEATQDNNVTSSEEVISYNLMIDKETLTMLMKKEGSIFIDNMSRMTNIKVKVQFSSTGGSLLLVGTKSQQDAFQIYLKNWIKEKNASLINSAHTSNLPRRVNTLLSLLHIQINGLYKSLNSPFVLYSALREIERNAVSIISDKQIKLYNRNLRKLNMYLFGKLGYRDGKMHMEKLAVKIRELESLVKTIEQTPADLYEEIKLHYDYIFSSVYHGDYQELLNLYENQRAYAKQAPNYELKSQTPYTRLYTGHYPGKSKLHIPSMFPTPNKLQNKSGATEITSNTNTNKSSKYQSNAALFEDYNDMLKIASHIVNQVKCKAVLKKKLRARLKPFFKKRSPDNVTQRDVNALQKFTKSLQKI